MAGQRRGLAWIGLVAGLLASAAHGQSAEPQSLTFTDSTRALDDAEHSVVRIVLVGRAYDGDYYAGGGSGFVVAPGVVLTNNHVVDTSSVTSNGQFSDVFIAVVPSSDSDDTYHYAHVTATSADGDMALLAVDGLKAPVITINTTMRKNERVESMGYPGTTDQLQEKTADELLNPSPVYTAQGNIAIFSDRNPIGAQRHAIFHTAIIGHGNSGGPLVDMCGQVIGINTWGAGPTISDDGIATNEGQYVASRADEIVAFLRANGVSPQVTEAACSAMTSDALMVQNALRADITDNRAAVDQDISALAKRVDGLRAQVTLLTIVTVLLVIAGLGYALWRSGVRLPARAPRRAATAVVPAPAETDKGA